MKRITPHLLVSLAVALLAASYAHAVPPLGVPVTLSTPGTTKGLILPPAADHTPVITLGEAVDPSTGAVVEGIAFVHKKKDPTRGGSKRKPGGEAVCYMFLGNGARWKNAEDFIFDTANFRGLEDATLRALLSHSTTAWDNEVSAAVFGSEVPGIVDGADLASPDGKNEVLFGAVSNQNTIAVTIVWGVFRGQASTRRLVEWDMIFNDRDFDWSADAAGVAEKMDFHNIAAHETGHAGGLGHPASGCTEETMHAYADFAETKKRDLNVGDIAGIRALYE